MSYRNLIGLPNEILYLIAVALELEDPRDLAALSQTCRRINSACHGLVEARRDMDKQYRIFHDRNPLAVPKLLKLASDDALKEAWHVRRVEFWDYRNDLDSMRWRETFTSTIYPSRDGRLRSRSADNLVREGTSRSVDDSPETEKWLSNVALQRSVEEVEATNAEGRHLLRRDLPMYRKMLEDVFGIEDESILEQDIHYDEQGAEELSKALLLSLCPNLDTLVFLGYRGTARKNQLALFSSLIRQCYLNKAVEWQPGFLSLRKISINSETDALDRPTFPRRGDLSMSFTRTVDIKPLFTLPNLKILRLCRVYTRNSTPGQPLWRLPRHTTIEPGTSSVEALEITKCDLWIKDVHQLLSYPRRLRYLQMDDPPTPMILRTLFKCPDSIPQNLERLSFRSISGFNLWVLANYTSLKYVEGITADCLIWRSSKSVPAPTGPQECFEFPVRNVDHEIEVDNEMVTLEALELTLPPNVETLSIHFLMMGDKGLGFFNAFVRELLRNVSGKAADESHTGADFAHLREVTFLLQNGPLPEDFEWDGEALADLKGRGVNVSHKQIPSTTEPPQFEDVDESQWQHCFEDRHYTDPRHEMEGFEGKKFGIVRSYMNPLPPSPPPSDGTSD